MHHCKSFRWLDKTLILPNTFYDVCFCLLRGQAAEMTHSLALEVCSKFYQNAIHGTFWHENTGIRSLYSSLIIIWVYRLPCIRGTAQQEVFFWPVKTVCLCAVCLVYLWKNVGAETYTNNILIPPGACPWLYVFSVELVGYREYTHFF